MEILLGVTAGLLVGAVGIGGVLVVPILSLWLDRDIATAIASASTSFLLPAGVACATYQIRGAIPWAAARPLCIAVVPGVLLGVGLGVVLPAAVLTLCTGLLLVVSGLHNLFGKLEGADTDGAVPSGRDFALLGIGVGAASALTGTGGPVLLSPILLWRRVPVRDVVGISQAISLPVAMMASVAYGFAGRVDFELAFTLGVAMAAGVPIGASLARRMSVGALHRAVAIAVCASGALLLLRSLG